MALVKCQNMQQDAHWSNQSEIPCIQSITLSITAYVQEKVNTASVVRIHLGTYFFWSAFVFLTCRQASAEKNYVQTTEAVVSNYYQYSLFPCSATLIIIVSSS